MDFLDPMVNEAPLDPALASKMTCLGLDQTSSSNNVQLVLL